MEASSAQHSEMELDFSYRKVSEWQKFLGLTYRANWLQSIPYAIAARVIDRKITRHALLKLEGKAIGIMAIQEIKLGPIHIVYLYRGPLFFSKNPPDKHFKLFSKAFSKAFPKRLLRKRRWIVEWKNSDYARRIMKEHGFKLRRQTFETVWIDLSKPESELRKSLKQKWRNSLNKAEKQTVTIEIDSKGTTMDDFVLAYLADKKIKGYKGRNGDFIRREMGTAILFKEMTIFWAKIKDKPVAGILLIHHGPSATYRIGFSDAEGRKINAHNLLLWNAMLHLKNKGLKFFDVGGVEPSTAEGLTHFKKGMGGESFQLVGVFS